jgi:hypothetical protein
MRLITPPGTPDTTRTGCLCGWRRTMQSASGASNTQKTIILSLSEGWSLRQNDVYGWCLFQPGRARPFAKVKQRTVEAMTDRGWIIEPLSATDALPMQPSRELTRWDGNTPTDWSGASGPRPTSGIPTTTPSPANALRTSSSPTRRKFIITLPAGRYQSSRTDLFLLNRQGCER